MFTMKWALSLLSITVLVVECAALVSKAEIQQKVSQGLRLISLKEDVDPVWKPRAEVFKLIKSDTNFFDVTDFYNPDDPETISIPSARRLGSIKYDPPSRGRNPKIRALLKDVSIPAMQQYLTNLTSFHNRYYLSKTGVDASQWIHDTMKAVTRAHPKSNAKVSFFRNTFNQSSIIGTIPGTNPKAPRVILGAHMDSINSIVEGDPIDAVAPGADDDGSGTVNLLEGFRVLVASGFKPSSTVEFHLYAGEEAGLLGSQAIVKAYKASRVSVRGMLNLDMTAYVAPGTKPVIGLLPDYTNPRLTTLVKGLVETYLSTPWIESVPCGYACSDHASWNLQGFPSAGALEGNLTNFNFNLHSPEDTVNAEGFSWSHLAEFTRLAIAFAVELSS